MFLKASTNSKADTVYHHFIEAISTFGLPQRVLGDQGVENIDVYVVSLSSIRESSDRVETQMELMDIGIDCLYSFFMFL